jgi:DNA-binding MltR family transcriptional regulator
MSKSLRTLSRTIPTRDQIEEIMKTLRTEKDISVAIVASAIVEASLEALLRSKMTIPNKQFDKDLFEGQGPLSSFSAKINIAQAFRFINEAVAKELHAFREIRNAFAHAKIPISFDDEAVANKVKALGSFEIGSLIKTPAGKLALSNKGWFLLATKLMLVLFEFISRHADADAKAIKDVLKAETSLLKN